MSYTLPRKVGSSIQGPWVEKTHRLPKPKDFEKMIAKNNGEMKKLLGSLIVSFLLAACSNNSSSSNDYAYGNVVLSWNAKTNAAYYIVTQTPGDYGSAMDTVTVTAVTSTTEYSQIFYVYNNGGTYTYTVSAYDSTSTLISTASTTVTANYTQTQNVTLALP
jgi:hypothetical protein